MKFKKCLYNRDDDTVDLYAADGTKISFLCSEIEAEITGGMNAMTKLKTLKIENPVEYAQMALNGSMQKYCEFIEDYSKTLASILLEQYKKRFPDISEAQINNLIRKFQLYDS